jgi:hypothetical protein
MIAPLPKVLDLDMKGACAGGEGTTHDQLKQGMQETFDAWGVALLADKVRAQRLFD